MFSSERGYYFPEEMFAYRRHHRDKSKIGILDGRANEKGYMMIGCGCLIVNIDIGNY